MGKSRINFSEFSKYSVSFPMDPSICWGGGWGSLWVDFHKNKIKLNE